MNTKRLLRLVAVMENVEAQQLPFDMEQWAATFDHRDPNAGLDDPALHNPAKTECGTACCAAGYAGLDPELRAEGLSLVKSTFDGAEHKLRTLENINEIQSFDGFRTRPKFGKLEEFRALEAFFDITPRQAEDLFLANTYPGYRLSAPRPIAPREVIDRINALLASAPSTAAAE